MGYASSIKNLEIHLIYNSIIAILLGLLIANRYSNSTDQTLDIPKFISVAMKEPANIPIRNFVELEDNTSYYEISPHLLEHPALRLWKWDSGLSKSQCTAIIKAAEAVNEWGEYSNFGKDTPTQDLSLDKLPTEVLKPVEDILQNIGSIVASKLMGKTVNDGMEMRFRNTGRCRIEFIQERNCNFSHRIASVYY